MNELVELIKKAQGNRSQNEYALHCGLNSATLTKIINGDRRPMPDTLKKLASRAHNGVTYVELMRASGYFGFTETESKRFYLDDETGKVRTARTPDFTIAAPAPQVLEVPDVLQDKLLAFNRAEFEGLDQYEVDRLAIYAEGMKAGRGDKDEGSKK